MWINPYFVDYRGYFLCIRLCMCRYTCIHICWYVHTCHSQRLFLRHQSLFFVVCISIFFLFCFVAGSPTGLDNIDYDMLSDCQSRGTSYVPLFNILTVYCRTLSLLSCANWTQIPMLAHWSVSPAFFNLKWGPETDLSVTLIITSEKESTTWGGGSAQGA